MSTIDTPPWQKLNFDRAYLDKVRPNLMTIMPEWWNGPPSLVDKVPGWVDDATTWGMITFALGSMGYDGIPPPFDDWREAGRRLVAAVVHYFFGAWRERFHFLTQELDRASARVELPWSDNYRSGLAVALSLSDWSSADQLLQWPGPDLPWDEGTDDRTDEDNAYQIWLAVMLRGEPAHAVTPQRAMIERGTRRRPKMLLAAADALLAGDSAGLSKALSTYLQHYRKREMRPNRIDFGVCLDATAVWHSARRRDMGEVPLLGELMILIARP